MRRLLLLVLPLALSACTPSMAPEAALENARAAEASGEARDALRYYRAAANAGDLGAMKTIARAYEEGYLRAKGPDAPRRQGEIVSHFMPVFVWPGQAGRWRERYTRERDAAALAGDPDAWMRVAEDLTVWNRDETQADRDSARAIRQRLMDEGYAPALLHVALNAVRQNPAVADSLLRLAEEAGSGQACVFRVLRSTQHVDPNDVDLSAAATARYIDSMEACPPLPGDRPPFSATVVENIRLSAENGSPEATAHLDSLHVLGVFDRYPHLAEM